jgi:hypothetical protein
VRILTPRAPKVAKAVEQEDTEFRINPSWRYLRVLRDLLLSQNSESGLQGATGSYGELRGATGS